MTHFMTHDLLHNTWLMSLLMTYFTTHDSCHDTWLISWHMTHVMKHYLLHKKLLMSLAISGILATYEFRLVLFVQNVVLAPLLIIPSPPSSQASHHMGQLDQFRLNGFKRCQTHFSQLHISLDPGELESCNFACILITLMNGFAKVTMVCDCLKCHKIYLKHWCIVYTDL